MTNDEIRAAVEELKSCIKKYGEVPTLKTLKPLLTLAEEYLKIEGCPEERKPTNFQGKDYSNPTDEEFNSTLRLCKLAAMKEKRKEA